CIGPPRCDMDRSEELTRQLKQHIESLKSAGVEWLPKAKPRGRKTAPCPEVGSSLFDVPAAAPTANTSLNPDQRRKELAVLAERISTCTRCAALCSSRTQTVFGVGPIDVDVCFIGEAPGADEDAQGEPFVGAAGQLLNKILAASGFKREEVYICNILKCRPPGNRTPRPDEAANCREYLDRQLELIRPKSICCLRSCAAQNLLRMTMPLGTLRQTFDSYNGIRVLCSYHPAFRLPHRSPGKKKDVRDDMKMLLANLGRPVPQ